MGSLTDFVEDFRYTSPHGEISTLSSVDIVSWLSRMIFLKTDFNTRLFEVIAMRPKSPFLGVFNFGTF